ncbi:MAG: ABC transporter ATP-binding protein [Patescibacteria group bacterium]
MLDKEDKEKKKFSVSAIAEMLSNTVRLLKIVWPEKKWLFIGYGAVSFVLALLPISNAGAYGLLINELVHSVGTGALTGSLVFWLAGLLFLYLLRSVLNDIDWYLNKLVWLYLEEKSQFLVLEKLGHLDVASFEDPKQKDLLQKVSESGTWRMQSFAEHNFYALQRIVEIITAAVALSFANWWMFVIIVIGIIPQLAVETRYGKTIWSIHDDKAETKRKFWHLEWKFKNVSSAIELKVFQNIKYLLDLIRRLFTEFHQEQYKSDKKRLKEAVFAGLLKQVSFASIYVYFVYQVVFSGLEIGTFTFFIGAVGTFSGALTGFFWMLGRHYQDNLFVSDVFKFLDIPENLKKPERGIVLNRKKAPKIEFENVSFIYPGTENEVLKDFSLVIESGEKIAFVGANGAGKTTIIKLLCRFYDPTKGRILIDGVDLKKIDLVSWYSMLGVLFQDYSNYHLVAKESIGIGRTDLEFSLEKARKSAQKSGAHSFISEWEKQYEQQVGKEFAGGVEPSIGQWQKLALARTFYRDPEIYILDEPTASIDAEAEAKIFEKLEKLSKTKTVMLISHRFSTVRHAQRIAVIENGEITELGSHEELLKNNKTYARLFKLQAKGYQ